MKTRFKKVIRDLQSDYMKNLMLVIAIGVGVFGIGAILGGYHVIKREMKENYMGTVPASATIEIEEGISRELVDSVKTFPGIQSAERHATRIVRMKVEDKWYPLLLFVVDDFKNKQTNKVYFVSGEREPVRGTMLVERTAFSVMRASEGDALLIKARNGDPIKVKLTGTVHDPGLAPAWQEEAGYGYITLSTLHDLGDTQDFDQLRILVSENQESKEFIREKAEAVASWLKDKGYTVHEIQIPPPGKHPHQGQMNTVMKIFVIFSFLILILGSILVATSMATLMVKQIRQIGVMKTIGARTTQLAAMYVLMVIVLCVVALVVAIPLSRITATIFYNQIAVLLNLEIRDRSIPWEVPLIQIAAGIGIPLIATAFPVIRGSRVSVRKALDNFGVGRSIKRSWITSVSSLGIFSDTFRLSIRNTFRQRSRLIMTLSLLGAGGAMFMTAMNVSEAWNKNLSRIYQQRLYDLEIRLTDPMRADSILGIIRHIPGVRSAEGWNSISTSFVRDNTFEITGTYPDKGHGSFSLTAVPLPTQLINPTIKEGRWLDDQELNEVVLNQLAREPGIKTGDSIVLSFDGKPTRWKVVGFTEDVGSSATAYVSLHSFSAFSGIPENVKSLRIGYVDRTKVNAVDKGKVIEGLLEEAGISIDGTVPVWLLHNAVAAHMRVLVNSLITIAILMALVGTLGLTSTMSVNVLERTREIGVMRAIGATPSRIRNVVVFEGLLIGVMSIGIAILLSLVLSTYMGQLIGNMSFRTPLSLTVSILALLVWIGIIMAGSYAASFYPARRAGRITTSEALSYE
ncbi:MAG TPA: FtsX-like permease family protein [Ohtaekwangia sp.]